jgi:DNA processing protein
MTAVSLNATALVALMRLRGVGRRKALHLLNAMDRDLDHTSYRAAILNKAGRAGLSESELQKAWSQAEEQLEASMSAGVHAFSFDDAGYPERLRHIPDPPAVLFVKGEVAGLHASRTLAVVGTREPTLYGAKVARKSGQTVAEAGFAVVSGLAHGCDTLGHEGCLDGKGIGVAVMAHGLDRVYPAANRSLAERLLEGGGCLVSEYPIGITPIRTAFAERDRIQSGLSDGVLVIETDVKGGTMHTVRFAREQVRALACVAHPEKWLCEEKTRGNQKLIADCWARPITDGESLLIFLNGIIPLRTTSDADAKLVSKKSASEVQQAWTF